MASWGRRRRRRRGGGSDGGQSGPWARTFAAAAVLVLLFGTVEVIGEWDRVSPFLGAPPDTLGPTAQTGGSIDAEATLGMPEVTGELEVGGEEEDTGGAEVAREEETVEPALAGEEGRADEEDVTGEEETSTLPPAEPDASEPGASSSEVGDSGRMQADTARTSMARMMETREAEEIARPREPGTLSLHTYPWGEVYLDGDFVGNSPIVELRVSAGSHEIRIEREGYEPYVEIITVGEGQVVRRTGIILRSGAR